MEDTKQAVDRIVANVEGVIIGKRKAVELVLVALLCKGHVLLEDVTGISIFNQQSREFEFRPGPVIAQIVLADEINRATPKTQSALLEAMEERQITVDG